MCLLFQNHKELLRNNLYFYRMIHQTWIPAAIFMNECISNNNLTQAHFNHIIIASNFAGMT
jgi:type IV secretory pathway VirB9-like protein